MLKLLFAVDMRIADMLHFNFGCACVAEVQHLIFAAVKKALLTQH
jgi:hypothetical protein